MALHVAEYKRSGASFSADLLSELILNSWKPNLKQSADSCAVAFDLCCALALARAGARRGLWEVLWSNQTRMALPGGKTHHSKLVLLGDTAVGKSCLVVRFVRDEFFEFQEPTIGGELVGLLVPFLGFWGRI